MGSSFGNHSIINDKPAKGEQQQWSIRTGSFAHKKIRTKKYKNAQQVENDYFVSTQNSTSRSTRERNE